MQLKTARWGALCAVAASLMAPTLSHAKPSADYARLRAQMVGFYTAMEGGDAYNFRPNGTYTFTAGPAKSASGNVSHSGRWSLLSYKLTREETDEGTVQLRSTSRVVMEGKSKKTLKANRTFKLKVGIPADVEGADISYLLINGRVFNLQN